MIEVVGLTKIYGARAAVDGIRTDMRALRSVLGCPGDAAGG